jgi:DNA replication protein DnaC
MWAKRMSMYLCPELLVLHDLGLKPLADLAPSDLYDVINERCEVDSMLVTSNWAPTERPNLLGNPLLASAGLDRLVHHAKSLVVTGPSCPAQSRQPQEKIAGQGR